MPFRDETTMGEGERMGKEGWSRHRGQRLENVLTAIITEKKFSLKTQALGILNHKQFIHFTLFDSSIWLNVSNLLS